MRKKLVIISLVVVLAMALAGVGIHYYSNRSKRALEKQVLAMNGMTIDLAFDKAKAVYDGVDSAYHSADVKKLLLYVDSLSCSSCFLSHLTNYYEINDSLAAHGSQMLVVMQPQKRLLEEIESRMSHERFPFWCIVDADGEFIKSNPGIPDNQLLHAFALDEQNKVILVGDPTRNDRIKELFYREVLR